MLKDRATAKEAGNGRIIHPALAIVAERFESDFDPPPETNLALRFEPPDESSPVYAFVLEAKKPPPSPAPGQGVNVRTALWIPPIPRPLNLWPNRWQFGAGRGI